MASVKSVLLWLFASLVLAVLASASADVKVEDGVLVLTEGNFDEVISKEQYVLVEFYAPWCGHCKRLAPEYAAAATELAGENVKLAKVDATVEPDLAGRFGIRGYPTLYFFKNGAHSEFSGGRTKAEIVSWLRKKTGPVVRTVASEEETTAFKNNANVGVLAFFDDLSSAPAKAFEAAASSVNNDDIIFAYTNNKQAFDAVVDATVVGSSSVVIFRNFEEPQVAFSGDVTEASLKEFVESNSSPVVFEFGEQTAPKIFGANLKKHFFLFVNSKADAAVETLKEVARQFKGKALFTFFEIAQPAAARVVDYFTITKDLVPAVRFVDMTSELIKYKPESEEVSASNWSEFVRKVLDGTQPRFLASQQPVEYSGTGVRVLVGTEHDSIAFDKTKNVFVEYYAPWCGHCKNLAPIWDQLSTVFEGVENVLIAKMDSTVNEVASVSIQGFPTLKFYPADADKAVDYSGGRTLDDLVKFVLEKSVGISDADKQKAEAAAAAAASLEELMEDEDMAQDDEDIIDPEDVEIDDAHDEL